MPDKVRSSHDDDDDDGYLDLDGLARYSSLSISTLRRYLKDTVCPLPHVRVAQSPQGRGRVLVRKTEFDAWLLKRFGAITIEVSPDDFSWIKTRH